MKDFFIRLVSDPDGVISSSRFVNVLIGVCSAFMMWKMVLMGGMSDTIWGLWLAYGGGTYGWSKYNESKNRPVDPPK